MNKKEWAWRGDHSEQAHGPFASRDEAMADALQHYAPIDRATIILGHVRWADPAWYVMDAVEDHLERMDEMAGDNGFGWYDDPIFDIPQKDMVAAQTDLTERLEAWARRWVDSNCWVLDEIERYEKMPEKEKP